MSVTNYLAGIAYLTITVGTLAVVGFTARRHFLGGWDGPPARLAEVTIGLATLLFAMEALGSVGLLGRVPLLALLIVMVGVVSTVSRRWPAVAVERPRAPGSPGWATALATAVALAALLSWAGGVEESLGAGVYRQDSTWYHLPFSAGFFQSGDTWALHFTDPMALTAWFYPQNSELLHAFGMLAFGGGDFLSVFANLGCLGLALLAAWCAGRPFGRGPEASIATAVVLVSGMMAAQAGNAPNDTLGVAFLLAAVALLLNGRETESENSGAWDPPAAVLAVAALAAGLAIGTKITLLAPVGVIAVGLPALIRRGRRRRAAGIWLAGLLAGGGYWYLRNTAHAGNPLPWLATGPLPGPDQAGLYPRPPHSVADYLGSPSIWVDWFGPVLSHVLGPAWPLVLLGALAGLALALVRGQALQRLLGAAGVAAVLAYLLIPVSASGSPGHPSGFESNLRYLAPALALGAVLAVIRFDARRLAARALAPALAALFAVGAVATASWDATALLPALALAALLALPALAWSQRGPAALRLALVLAIPLIAVAGYAVQRDYGEDRYDPRLAPALANPGFRGTPQWARIQAWAQSVRDARIAIVGPPAAFGQYVLYGSDLSNRVSYVGEPGARGALRPIADCGRWRRAVNELRPDYVVVTPATESAPSATPQETLWTITDPHAEPLLRLPPATVFRLDGPLDPAACAAPGLPPAIRVPGGGFAVPGTRP